MDSSLEKLKKILKTEIGLDADTVGKATISKILNQRMRNCHITELDDYYNFLQGNREELHLLLEISTIPETWFFRDQKPFKAILNSIRKSLLNNPDKTCNILCIPCSTGEEPYSISIFLLQQGIPEKMFDIQAVDINHQSLEIARNGCYGENSFRGKNAKKYIDRYFELKESQYRIDNNVKNKVEFHRANILDGDSMNFKNKFDFILCRNLLIYFDLETKNKAFSILNKLLTDDGILFIGHSEFGSVPENIFSTIKKYDTYCLEKTGVDQKENIFKATQNKAHVVTKTKSLKIAQKPVKKAFSNTKKPQLKPQKKEQVSIPANDLLLQARKFADSGQFNDAEHLCFKYIEEQGDHSETFFLLGLISESSGKTDQAHHLYKKALYLDPKHYETLIHLSYIVEQQGNTEASQRLKDRAKRSIKH